MIQEYVERGVAAGLVAGLAYGLYMVLVGHPLSEYVHDAGHDHGHSHDSAGHAHEHVGHAVSEVTTALVSTGSGVLWGIFLGGVFALALYLLEPALPGSVAVKPYVLAGAGFLTVSAIPWLVLPPAAPGAEHLYAIEPRLAIYLGLVFVGAATVAATLAAYKRGARRGLVFGLVAGAAPILAVAVGLPLATPTVTTHPGLPADLVAAYQGLAALSQATLWLLIAVTFERLQRRMPIREARSAGTEHERLPN